MTFRPTLNNKALSDNIHDIEYSDNFLYKKLIEVCKKNSSFLLKDTIHALMREKMDSLAIELLNHYSNIEKDSKECLLMDAVTVGSLEVAKYLLGKGADPDHYKLKDVAIWNVTYSKNDNANEILDLLLEKGLKLYAQQRDFERVIAAGRLDLVEDLLRRSDELQRAEKIEIDQRCLSAAVEHGRNVILLYLLNKQSASFLRPGGCQETQNCSNKQSASFLRPGGCQETQNCSNKQSASFLSPQGRQEIQNDPEKAPNPKLGWALYAACSKNNDIAVEILLKYGAVPDKATCKMAVLEGTVQTVRILLDHGTPVEKLDIHDPLKWDDERQMQITIALLEYGGDISRLTLQKIEKLSSCDIHPSLSLKFSKYFEATAMKYLTK